MRDKQSRISKETYEAHSPRTCWHWPRLVIIPLSAIQCGRFFDVLKCVELDIVRASVVAQMVKNPTAMQETWVLSLGWEDPLEEGMATHSHIVAWRILMDGGTWRAAAHWVAKSWT